MKKFKRFCSAVIVLLCFYQTSFALIRTASVTGAWNNIATWGGLSAPVAGDDAFINDGITVTVTSNVACATLTVGQGVSGILSFNTLNMNITVTGLTTINAGAAIIFSQTTAGVRSFADIANGGTWNTTNFSTPITITGSIINNGVFTSGAGAYTLSGATKTISGTTAALTFAGAVAMSGTYTNNVSTLTVTGILSGAGTLTMGTSTTLILTATPSITGLDCTTNTPNTVVYNGAAQTVKSGIAYYNLTIQTAGIKTINAINTTINNNLTINAGSLYDGGNQIVGNTTGTFSIAAGATFQMGAAVAAATTSNWPTNFTTATSSVSATSTVIYNTTAAVTVSAVPANYGNLTLSGASTKTAGGAHVINGTLTVNPVTTGIFADGGNTITVNGNVVMTGSHSGAGKIYLNGGAAAHALSGAGTYTNLELDDAFGATLATATTIPISGTLTLTNGVLTQLGTNTLSLTGTIAAAGAGTITTTTTSVISIGGAAGGNYGSLRFTGGAQTVGTFTINRTGASAAVDLGSGVLTVQTTLNLTNGSVTISGTGNLSVGVAATNVACNRNAGSLSFVPNFTYTTGAYNITYNGGAAINTGNELPPSTTPTNGILAVSVANTNVTLMANANIGTLTTSLATNTFNLNGFILGLSLATALNNTGTLTANASGSTILLNGAVAQTFAVAGTYTGNIIDNLTSVNSSTGATLGSSVNVNNFTITSGTFSLGAGSYTLSIAGTYTNSGTLTADGAGATLNFNGIAAQTFTVGTYTSSTITNFKLSNAAGVTLNAPVNATTLTLNAAGAALNTTTNNLTVTGTTAANVVVAVAGSFVNGPLIRTLPASTSGITWQFPVGKTANNLFEILNPTTTGAGTVLITVEAFDGLAGGSDGTDFVATPTPANRYWSVSVSGAGAISTTGTVRITEASVAFSNTIGNSATQTGTYNGLGGAVVSNAIVSYLTPVASYGYFKIGTKSVCFGPATYPVGPTGTYLKLTDAFAALNTALNMDLVCGDVIFELQTTYDGTAGETFPLTISGSAGPYTVTIRPESSVAATLTVQGNVATPLITLNGSGYIIFDGRPGGSGTSKFLTIDNQNALGTDMQFINDASNNIVEYCVLKGIGTSTSSGTIVFSTAAVGGNDNNTIDNCDITAGATLPANAIYSAGTSAAIDNSGISITNNNISDYFSATVASNGIYVASNSSAWTITGNKFFQTATRTSTVGNTHRAINIVTASGTGYTVNNNIIGYATSTATGVTTYDGAFANLYRGIEMTVGTASASNVQGNTITAISLSTTSASSVFIGISILAGTVNIGTTSANTIGAITGTGSILITSTTTGSSIYGIYAASTGTSIQNNNIGAISTGSAAAIAHTFYGISTSGGGGITISSNTIGSTATANSIAVGISGTTTAATTFIGINNAATGTVTITSNTIQNASSFGTGASAFTGINNTGGSTKNINSNNIISGTHAGTGAFIGISNTVNSVLNINNNTIRNTAITSATGAFTGINNTGTVNSTSSINNNHLGDASGELITYTIANSGAFTGINVSSGTSTGTLTINSNDIRGINYTAASSGSHTYIQANALYISKDINSNTFTNLNVNTTGSVTFITILSGGGAVFVPIFDNVNNNAIVTGYNKSGAGGTVYFFFHNQSGNSWDTETASGNNFSNITLTGATTIGGWYNRDGCCGSYPWKIFTNNTFNNITTGAAPITLFTMGYLSSPATVSGNVFSNITGGGAITGMFLDAKANFNIFNNTLSNFTGAGNILGVSETDALSILNFYQNTLSGFSTTGTSAIGIQIANTGTRNIYKNKICNIQADNAAGIVNGINVAAGTNVSAYNNYIGDLRAPSTTSASDAIKGINLNSAEVTSNLRVYYNTIYINTSSTGADFFTTGIYHLTNATSTTANLTLRNNIIINTSTPNGTGITSAYRRSSIDLTNFNAASNNNLFYAGTPSATNLIFYDGTNSDQTLAAYQTRVNPIDAASVTELPPFMSTTCSDATYLHFNGSVFTLAESGAVNIASFTTDYDADIRQGNPGYSGTGTAPDIGADEFESISLPIELLSFTGYNKGNTNILNWTTATEINNDYFTLEKTKDGLHYAFVGQVKGAGNSSTSLHYQLIDAEPYEGTSYYRLKQTDYNGTYTYSDLVPINYLPGDNILNIYPNPARDEFVYEIGSTEKKKLQIKIVNVLGQTVFNKTETIEKGISKHTLNISELSNGTYSLQIITENNEVKGKQFQIVR